MKKILILDDETSVLNALQRQLIRNNWQVMSFKHPASALDYAKHGFFPIVITDYRMPQMSGVEFLLEFQKLQPYAYKIMLSGQAGEYGMTEAINQAKIDYFIHKPWDNRQLLNQIDKGLNHYRQTIKHLLKTNSKRMSREDYLIWYEKLVEQACPGITKVKKNPLGWIEAED